MSVLTRPVPWALASVCALALVDALALVGAPIVTATSGSRLGWSEVAVVGALSAMVGGAGLFLALREAARAVGIVLLVLATVIAVDLLLDTAAAANDRGAATATAWRLVASLASLEWILTFALLATLALVFPDGRPAGAVFARILRLSVVPYLLIVVGHVLDARPNDDDRADIPGVVGLPGADVLTTVGLAGALVVFGAAVASVALRYRRARGIERLQVLWLAWSIGLVPVTVVACIAASALPERARTAVVGALFFASVAAIVGSVVVAVTWYRLYAVERVVNRTLVYLALSGLLGGVWGGLVLIGGLLGGQGSPLVTAIATLVAATAFGPARRRVQALVDRRFDRTRLAAVAQIAAFSDAVRDGTAEPEAIVPVLRSALGDPTVTLAVHGADDAPGA